MDKGTVSRRVAFLEDEIRSKVLMICQMSIALDLFETGLNTNLQIKTKRKMVEYLHLDELVDDINRGKQDVILLARRLQIAKRQLTAMLIKETISSKPKKV